MRRFATVAALAASVACGAQGSGIQPDDVLAKPVSPSAHHNLTVTDMSGELLYVCSTQPRQYCGERCTWEIDHYLSTETCPATPID